MSIYLPTDHCRKIPVQMEIYGLPVSYWEGNVSSQFVRDVWEALNQLPEFLVRIVSERGFVLILSGLLSDAHPEQKYQKPRGHGQHTKGDDLCGLCCSTLRHIHLAEFAKDYKPRDALMTLRHELGHALDYTVGACLGLGYRDVSLNYEFNQAHLADVAQMDHRAKLNLNYYIQNCSTAGRAEAVAALLGGGCQDSLYFRQQFPHVTNWVQWNLLVRLNSAD